MSGYVVFALNLSDIVVVDNCARLNLYVVEHN